MESVWASILAGGCLFIITGSITFGCRAIKKRRNKRKAECKLTATNAADIKRLETESTETKELVKLTLGMCIILGDGMIQSGVNGDVKKAFARKKQDALKFL